MSIERRVQLTCGYCGTKGPLVVESESENTLTVCDLCGKYTVRKSKEERLTDIIQKTKGAGE